MAETYGKFIQNNRDEGSHTIIREHAHKAMFSLTLEQAEKNLEKRFAFDARTSKVILKIIKALKVK